MNKKQVAAFLKIMSKDDSRPVLCTAYVDKFEDRVVLVATDAYRLSAVYLEGDEAEELVGKLIRRTAIERWYKLATGKSRLTAEELKVVANEDVALNGGEFDGKYPEWQKLVPTTELDGQKKMAFNAEFFKAVQDLNDTENVTVELRGILAPMVVRSNVSYSMVMPIKQ